MRLLLLLVFAGCCSAQCVIQTINGTDPVSTGPAKLNANFSALNLCKTTIYSGTTVPGSISTSLKGDFYINTSTNLAYQCFGAVPCTAVASGNWVCLNCGGGSGTVTVVGAGNLTSTALMTGGGSQTAQTPSATATLASNGNIGTPGTITTGVGGSSPGTILLGPTTVSGLPTCNSGAQGTHASVTDANATTFLSAVAGGGSNKVPVYCNGSAWVIG